MKNIRFLIIIFSVLSFIIISSDKGHALLQDIRGDAERTFDDTVRGVKGEAVRGAEPGGNVDWWTNIGSKRQIDIKIESSPNRVIEEIEREDDRIFMGDEGEGQGQEQEIVLEPDTPEYLEAKRKIFIDTAQKFETKPLKLTLEDCIRIALLNNNKVQAADLGIEAAKARLMESQATFYPIFEYEWLNAPVPTNVDGAVKHFFEGDLTWWNKVRVAMGMPVYAFGKLRILQDMASGGIAAARAEKGREKLSVTTQVRHLYYGALLAKEMGRLLEKAHDKLSKDLEEETTETGEKKKRSPVDRIQGRVFLVDLEKRLAEARNKELLALEGLRVQMGLNPDVAIDVYGDRLRPVKSELRALDDYINIALKSRPDVNLVEVGLETRRKQYSLEKKRFFPDVGLGAYLDMGRTTNRVSGVTATGDFSDPFNFTRFGFGVRVQGSFDPHGQYARVKKAKSDYYKASLEHYMAKDGIALEVKKAYLDAETSLDDVRRADKSQELARQLMFLTQSNYELGVGEKQEYVDALKLVLFTRGKYFEAIFNYNVALAILDEKSGILPDYNVINNEISVEKGPTLVSPKRRMEVGK